MTNQSSLTPKAIVDQMMANDAFSRWLGIQVLEVKPGAVRIQMTVRPEMINGLGTAHGGIQYSLADSALAFAANSHGRRAVALENVISYPAPVRAGDVLTAAAQELHLGNTIATYDIVITNQNARKVALFRGNVYRLKDKW